MKFIPQQNTDGSFSLALIGYGDLTPIEVQILNSLVGSTLVHYEDSTALNHYIIEHKKENL